VIPLSVFIIINCMIGDRVMIPLKDLLISLSFSIEVIDNNSHCKEDTGSHYRVCVQVEREDDAADQGKGGRPGIEGDLKAPQGIRHGLAEPEQAEVDEEEREQGPEIQNRGKPVKIAISE
jgi:hypothetical protein